MEKQGKTIFVSVETDGQQDIDKWLVPQGQKHRIGFIHVTK